VAILKDGHRLLTFSWQSQSGQQRPRFMWKKLVHGYRQLVDDEPGHRFLNAYERRKGSRTGPAVGVALIAAGVLLILVGALLSLVPGVPGIVLGVPGLALIATRFRRVAIASDWLEMKCRRIWRKFRRRKAFR
jgi:hypothetical protein